MKIKYLTTIACLIIGVVSITACKKQDYFIDGGISGQSDAEKSMLAYDFLASRPNHMFDSLLKVIDLTNTKALINQDNITFYAIPNAAIIRFQQQLMPNDRLIRPLNKIGVDTLKLLLNRFIVPNKRFVLSEVLASTLTKQPRLDEAATFPMINVQDNNLGALQIYAAGGGLSAGSTTPSTANFMIYIHKKKIGVDSVNYRADIQTHNLVTKNATIHVLSTLNSLRCGLKIKGYRAENSDELKY